MDCLYNIYINFLTQTVHAGANPLENIRKILSFLTIMNSNFLIKINLDGFQHSAIFSQRNWHFKNIKIVENFKKTQLLFINQHFCMFIKQNLFQNIKNFISGFFPDFPDPVFSLKKILYGLVRGQTLCHFVAYFYNINYICSLACWQKLAGMKNAKNILFLGL